MTKPGKDSFNYGYDAYQAIINDLDAVVRDAMTFIARNDSLDAFMGDIVFNRGEKETARELRNRLKAAHAPDYVLAALTMDDLLYITNIYNHPISLLLRENNPKDH